jgi:hypothetical protein
MINFLWFDLIYRGEPNEACLVSLNIIVFCLFAGALLGEDKSNPLVLFVSSCTKKNCASRM